MTVRQGLGRAGMLVARFVRRGKVNLPDFKNSPRAVTLVLEEMLKNYD